MHLHGKKYDNVQGLGEYRSPCTSAHGSTYFPFYIRRFTSRGIYSMYFLLSVFTVKIRTLFPLVDLLFSFKDCWVCPHCKNDNTVYQRK
jgi:hypothetical protein